MPILWIDYLWFAIGLLAQACFSARFLVQWLLSEKAKRSLMPIHFWYFSLAGAVLLLAYAVHRRDPVITTGQLIGLLIYLRNLQLIYREKNGGVAISWLWAWLLLALPAIAIGYELGPDSAAKPLVFDNFWTSVGFVGQTLFTSRFLVQWWSSERAARSVTPTLFWYFSLAGSFILLAYAMAVADPIIILGQTFGVLIYVRNLLLIRNAALKQRATTAS